MNLKHTPEPWRIGDIAEDNTRPAFLLAGEYPSTVVTATVPPFKVYNMNADTATANAFRIAACVNALAGIEDPEAFVKEAKAALQKDKFPFL
jgi:hypothetical protein